MKREVVGRLRKLEKKEGGRRRDVMREVGLRYDKEEKKLVTER